MKLTTTIKPNKLDSPKAGRFNVVASTLAASLICTGIVYAQGKIVSGNGNSVPGSGSVIVGGNDNTTSGLISVITGGAQNKASAQGAVVVAGFQQDNKGFDTAIITGIQNKADTGASGSVILAGSNNRLSASAASSFIGAGKDNVNNGKFAAIAAGTGNSIGANGDNSQAGGVNASANHKNCFVFNSDSTATFPSTADNQFLLNVNSIGFGTNTPEPNALSIVVPKNIIHHGVSNRYGSTMNFPTNNAKPGFIIENGNDGADNDSSGFFANPDTCAIWSPADLNGELVSFWEEDTGQKVAYINAGGAYVQLSAREKKKNIEPLKDALSTVRSLQGVSYQWRTDDSSDIGFIADDVLKVIPDAIAHNQDGSVMGMSYQKIIAVNTEAIKQVANLDDARDKRIKQLENKLERLEKLLEKSTH